jgi:hypothetical protein
VLPYCSGIWISGLCCFYAIQAILVLQRPPSDWLMSHLIHGIVLTIMSVVLIIGYGVGYRLDGAYWAAALFIVCGLYSSLFLQLRERRQSVFDKTLGEVQGTRVIFATFLFLSLSLSYRSTR